jgi:uroporphyrinogen III methyltransferase/synthase
VIEAPVIRTEPLVFSVPPDLARFDLVVFSSPNGVRTFFDALRIEGRDARALAGARVAVVGPGTADALSAQGITADLMPTRAVGESLAELLSEHHVARALVVRARGARTVVADALKKQGSEVEVVEPYVTVNEPLDERAAARVLAADWATVTSASSVRALCDAVGGPVALASSGVRLASIGPITTAELERHGLAATVEADPHTPAGLVAALIDQSR